MVIGAVESMLLNLVHQKLSASKIELVHIKLNAWGLLKLSASEFGN